MKNNKLVIANWKMDPQSESEAITLARASDAKNVVLCPPFPYLASVKNVLKRAYLGAQDVFWENTPQGGAYTGEVSGGMLKKLGVRYVIIGHSERRRWLGETDEIINKKIKVALGAGLRVILCVGEPSERGLTRTPPSGGRGLTRNYKAAKSYVREQLEKDLRGIRSLMNKKGQRSSASRLRQSALIVAYEPVWAIGTGRPDNPADSAKMAKYIKNVLASSFQCPASSVLYGGSVTSSNVRRILQYDEIDGVLVGGASIVPGEFSRIVDLTSKHFSLNKGSKRKRE